MGEVTTFIQAFLGAPLQIVHILAVIGVLVYWFIKIRPAEKSKEEETRRQAEERALEQQKIAAEEKVNFLKALEEYRGQNERISSLYDKALENSTRAIENNTETMKNQSTYIQLNTQALEALNASSRALSDDVDTIYKGNQEILSKVKESIVICQNKK